MNSKNKRLITYITVLCFAILSSVAFRICACLLNFESDSGYFDEKILITIANATATVACIGVFTYVFTGPRFKVRSDFGHPSLLISSGVCAVAEIFLASKLLIDTDKRSPAPLFSAESLATPANLLAVVTAILALLSVMHLFLNAFIEERHHNARASFAMITVAFLACYASYLYFNTDMPINAPNKIVDQMAFLFGAIFFLYDARLSLGREKWRGYAAFGMICACLCAYSSIPALTYYVINGEPLSASVEENVLVFTLFIYSLARIIVTVKLPQDKESAAIKVLDEYADHRSKQVLEDEMQIIQPEAVQITIDDILGIDGATISISDLEDTESEEEEGEPQEQAEEQMQSSLFDDEIVEAEAMRSIPNEAIASACEEAEEVILHEEEEEEEEPEQIPDEDKIIESIRSQYASIDNIYAEPESNEVSGEKEDDMSQISFTNNDLNIAEDVIVPEEAANKVEENEEDTRN